MQRLLKCVALTFALLVLASAQSNAMVVGFEPVSNNSGSSDTLAQQFTVEVTNSGDGGVVFKISNTGPTDSAITQIYWDDSGDILNEITGQPDSFGSPATPGNLPDGNDAGFTANSSAGANNPAPQNGIGQNQMASFVFDVDGNAALVFAALQSGDLRIGLHVQSIGGNDGPSDSFVSAVPLPAASLLFVSALSALGFATRRRLRSKPVLISWRDRNSR